MHTHDTGLKGFFHIMNKNCKKIVVKENIGEYLHFFTFSVETFDL